MLGEIPGEKNSATLMQSAQGEDDFHRLSAVESLCKLGNEAVIPRRAVDAETASKTSALR
jgi:hypothetical protein